MPCPNCAAPTTTEMRRRTTLGYRMFHCRTCRRTCNERTGTPFNHLQVPTDIAVLVVLWRLQYKLSLRNVAEMFLTRGFSFTHETVRDWEERCAPLLTARLKARRRGKAGRKWRVDELRHEVACRAVEALKEGLNRALCRPYPTEACGWSNLAV